MEPAQHGPTLVSIVDPALVGANQRVAGDVPCASCAYNLRTLLLTGRCPECNAEVMPSVVQHGLRHGVPARVRRLAEAASSLSGAIMIFALAVVLVLVGEAIRLVGGPSHADLGETTAMAGGTVTVVIFLPWAYIAVVFLTAPAPVGPPARRADSLRRVTRGVAVSGAVAVMLALMSSCLSGPGAVAIRLVLVLAAGLAILSLPVLTLLTTARLMRRVARETLRELALRHVRAYLILIIGWSLGTAVFLAPALREFGAIARIMGVAASAAYLFYLALFFRRARDALQESAEIAAAAVGHLATFPTDAAADPSHPGDPT